jgi:MoaD family protein
VIRVRVFAVLRELAGAGELEGRGRTAGEVVDELGARFGARFADVAAVSSLVVNQERASRETVVADGDEVAILPPVSGGRRVDRERGPRGRERRPPPDAPRWSAG